MSAPSSNSGALEYEVHMTDIRNDPGLPENYSEQLKKLLINLRINTDIAGFCEISSEILDNFILHSEEQYGLIAFQYFLQKQKLSLCFGDCGIGFRNSLSKNPSYKYLLDKPSAYSISEAIKEEITRFQQQRGSGLAMLIEYVLENKGELFITSENGYFTIDANGKPQLGDKKYNLPGVQIEFRIPENV